MANSHFVFMGEDNKVFCTMERFPGPLNDLLTAAFASGVQGMNISEYPNAQRGDVWDGSDFVKMSAAVDPVFEERIALLVDNEIVDILDLDKNYPYYNRWIDGFSKKHIGMNATGYDNARSGAIWNGESFIFSEDPAI